MIDVFRVGVVLICSSASSGPRSVGKARQPDIGGPLWHRKYDAVWGHREPDGTGIGDKKRSPGGMEMQDRDRFSLGALADSIQPLGPDAVVSVASGEEVELLAVGRPSRLAIHRL